jgi:Tfp pilus assembly PilM family ATPase
MKASNFKISKYLIAKEYIGGLEITDYFLRFVLFDPVKKDKIILSFELELDPEIVVNGELKKPEILKDNLIKLRNHPALKKIKNLYIILTLQSNVVYYKIFDLPTVDYKSIISAVSLNMKMLSPIPFEKSYSDWELMDTPIKNNSFELKVLSVFAEKRMIDPYLDVLNKTRFNPLVVEFNGLSLWRFFSHYNIFEREDKNYLGIYINSNGLEFILGNKKGLEFNFFQSWKDAMRNIVLNATEVKEGVLTRDNFIKIFNDNFQKVITFYFTRFQESIEKVFLTTPVYFDDLKSVIEDKFNLTVENSISKIKNINPNFFISTGSALRGLISRADDISVSLMAIGTEDEYRTRRNLNFINLWLKIITEVGVVMLLLTIGLNIFMNYTKTDVLKDKEKLSIQFDRSQLENLSNKAKDFNVNLLQAIEAKNNTKDWFLVFDSWNKAKNDIVLKNWIIPGVNTVFSFDGLAPNQSEMIKFRDNLSESGYFTDLDVPLQSIVQQKTQVEFNLKGKIKL